MKLLFRVLTIALFVLNFNSLYATNPSAGDTIKVQTFTFGSKQDSVFLFPPDTFNCSKVLMYYKLKCPTGGCGEWDYLTYTYLYQPTGKIDSYSVKAPFFIVNGQTLDSFAFRKKAAYSYTYNSGTSSVDSTPLTPLKIVFYRNGAKPSKATDTMTVWNTYYRIRFDGLGNRIDSALIKADSTLHQTYTTYYVSYPDNIRYELARYITPYGIGLDLGKGFTWVYDVSDYRKLLHDSVHLSAGNWQEWLDMSFAFVKGTPARDVKSIQNLWNGQPAYGTSTSIEKFLHPITVKLDPNTNNWRVKMRTTGHGFGGTDNCSEFCPRLHSIDVDGTTRFKDTMFRYDCSQNPVYPQGGTWVYSRSNWCPGSYVKTYDYELSPYGKAGDSITLDYNVQPYTWNGVGSLPYYSIETQLVSYGPPNFHTNASVEDILSPTNKDIHRRWNPVCGQPTILIKNNGSDPLTSLDITYGLKDTIQVTYHWTGNLNFLDTVRVVLSSLNWDSKSNIFQVSLSNPNGKQDEYSADNAMSSYFDKPPTMANNFIVEMLTNNAGSDNTYTIADSWGDIILNRNSLKDNTKYRDTLKLKNGCYTLRVNDATGDGLSWWANAGAGIGYFELRNAKNKVIKVFNPDFGSLIYYEFTVGAYATGIEESIKSEAQINLYPNPSEGNFTLSLDLPNKEKIYISVTDALGREIYTRKQEFESGDIPIELSHAAKGWYIVRINTAEGNYFRKLLVK